MKILIKSKIKELLISFCLLFTLCNGISVFATEIPAMTSTEVASKSKQVNDKVENELKATTLEEYQKDLSNRMILGIFGKDALIYSLTEDTPDNIKKAIGAMSPADIEHYSKPFNIANLSGLLMIFSSFFFIAITVLGMYLIWILFEGLFNTQDSGQMLGEKTNLMFSILKSSTALALIVPAYGFSHKPFSDFSQDDGKAYGSYSLSQISVFIATGYSNQFANHIWGSFVTAYQKAYPSISLPNTNAKEKEMSEILDYVMCVKSKDENINVPITYKIKNGTINFSSKFENCFIDGGLSYDAKTLDEMSKNEKLNNLIGKNIDSLKTEYETYIKEIITKTFKKAETYASLILKERAVYTENQNNSPLLVTASNWDSLCDTPEKMFVPNETTNDNTYVLKYFMSKCLSNEFILSYLSKDKDKAKSFYKEALVTDNKLPICNSPAAISQGQRTYVKTDNSVLKSGLEMPLNECVKTSCNNISSSGIYQCLSSLEFAKSTIENEDMIKKGWINAGAYSYVLFSGFRNDISKGMVSSLTTRFSHKSDAYNAYVPAGNSLHIINAKMPTIKTIKKTSYSSAYVSFKEKESDSMFKVASAKEDSDALLLTGSQSKNIITGKDGLFGIAKFITCTRNPNSITDGYMCGNTTEEMHDMGAKMLAFSIEMKLAQSLNKLTTAYGGSGKGAMIENASSSVSEFFKVLFKNKVEVMSKFADTILKHPTSVAGGVAGGALVATHVSGEMGITDAFSEDGYWTQNGETYLILIGLMANHISFVGGFLDFFVGLLMVLGFIFGFFLPLLPYFLWLTVITGWVVMILEFLVVIPIWAATLITPSHNHTNQTAKKGVLLLLTITMRAPFMIIGLVLAWMLSNVLIGEILQITNISESLLLPLSGGTLGIVDAMVKLIVYLSMLYLIYNLVFSIIEGFFEIGSNWLFNGALSPFANKERSESWRGHYGTTKTFLGVKK